MSTGHQQQQHQLATHMAHKKVPNSCKSLPAISPLTQLGEKVLMQVANLWDLVEDVTDHLCLQDSSLMSLKRLHVHLQQQWISVVGLLVARDMHNIQAPHTHFDHCL